jgi:flavin-dependent dehydrogenase
MIKNFEVLIAGGGPAGSAVALNLARQGCRVALMEATTYNAARYGETLPPEINPVLRRLELWQKFQALSPLEATGMISAWGDASPVETDFVRNVHGSGWHIDRRQFDAMLTHEAAKAGAQIYSGHRLETCNREGEYWSAAGHQARILVDASGRNGLRIEADVDRETEDELLAMALTISYSGEHLSDLRTCIETTSRGWWYSAPLPDGTAMAMFFTDPLVYREEGISAYEELEAAPLTARRVQGGRIQDSRVLHVTSSCRKTMFCNGWLAVGDSASSYDPLSGRGVFKALQHASLATTAILASLNGDQDAMVSYAAQVRQEFDDYVRQRRLYYAAERRWPEHPFWKARSKPI